MKGSETKLLKYMEGADKRFVIPVYQRNYDWKIENCKQLYDDLIKVIRENKRSHFFGSIVSSYNPDGDNEEYQIIDGQQRLTTVSLLLLAMYNLMEKGVLTPVDSTLKTRVYEDYLVDKYQPTDTHIKLKPIKNDSEAFSRLFEEESEYINDSNLTVNYKYFLNRIQKEELSLDQLFKGIRSLEIIKINLDQEDDPQLIFESLNSTGLDLSEGDKIRNYILMGIPVKQQEVYYEKYWNKIETRTEYQVDLFIRDYLSVKQHAIPSMQKIYSTFKKYVEDKELEIEELLEELLSYAGLYHILLTGDIDDKRISSCIDRLNRLETTVVRAFFLEVLRLWRDDTLSLDDVSDVLTITENYVFRRTICELPTNQLRKIFLLLHGEIMNYDGTPDLYVEKLKYAYLSKKENARFPNDDEFADAICDRQIYQMSGKNKKYLFERLENHGTAEDKDVYRHIDADDYSVEHIMPQKLTQAWVEALGDDYEEIQKKWLHRLANLTLTAYNPEYSNRSFSEKRDMENGFRDSGIRMNRWIGAQKQWGEEELQVRNEFLRQQALKIWPAPVTSYQPAEKQYDVISLDDEIDLTGRRIVKFKYMTLEKSVKNWIQMFCDVIQMMHYEDRSVLNALSCRQSDNDGISKYFSQEKENLNVPSLIDDGIYVEGKTSTQLKITILKQLFEMHHHDMMDLILYLSPESEDDSEEDNLYASRFERRRAFWNYSMGRVKEANEKNGLFRKCNSTKENCLLTALRISGCFLGLVANLDSASVIIYLNSNREKNKNMFDSLVSHKSEIETNIGTTLNWDRGDNRLSSKISS